MSLPQFTLKPWNTRIENLPVLAFGHFQDAEIPSSIQTDHPALSAQLQLAIDRKVFTGKLNSLQTFTVPDDPAAPLFVAVGLGKSEDYDSDKLRQATASLGKALNGLKVKQAALEFFGENQLEPHDAQALAEGLILGSYRFLNYQAEKEDDPVVYLEDINVLSGSTHNILS